MSANEPQRSQMARHLADYARARSNSHRAIVLDQMEVVAKGSMKKDAIVAALKSSGRYEE